MTLPALLAASAAVLIAVPAHGQVRMRITQADREVLDFSRCYVSITRVEPFKVISHHPCTKFALSNTGRSVNIHFTTGAGTSTFVIENSEMPDDDGRYWISGSAFTPRGEGQLPLPNKAGLGGTCSLPTPPGSRLWCAHLIDGLVISGDVTLE
jgi:hypothetical protein